MKTRAHKTVIKDFQNFPAVAIFDFESKERVGKERSNWGRRRVKKNTPFFSYFFSLFTLITSSLVFLSPVPAPPLPTVHAVEHHKLRKFLVITDNHDVGYNTNENEKK